MSADTKTLAALATQLEEDAGKGFYLDRAAMKAVANVIRQSISSAEECVNRILE